LSVERLQDTETEVVLALVRARFAGADGAVVSGGPVAGGLGATAGVAAELADAEPPALLAVTTIRTVAPTSAAPSRKLVAVAPATSAQFAPLASQRRHW